MGSKERTLVTSNGQTLQDKDLPGREVLSFAMAAVELDPAKLRQELAELAEKRGEVSTMGRADSPFSCLSPASVNSSFSACTLARATAYRDRKCCRA